MISPLVMLNNEVITLPSYDFETLDEIYEAYSSSPAMELFLVFSLFPEIMGLDHSGNFKDFLYCEAKEVLEDGRIISHKIDKRRLMEMSFDHFIFRSDSFYRRIMISILDLIHLLHAVHDKEFFRYVFLNKKMDIFPFKTDEEMLLF